MPVKAGIREYQIITKHCAPFPRRGGRFFTKTPQNKKNSYFTIKLLGLAPFLDKKHAMQYLKGKSPESCILCVMQDV